MVHNLVPDGSQLGDVVLRDGREAVRDNVSALQDQRASKLCMP